MPIGAGTYTARALPHTAELIESEGKGTPGVKIVMQLEGGGSLTWTGWLTGGATEITVKALRAMGWQGDDLSDLSTVGSVDCELVVEEEEYNGKWYPKIKFVNVPGGGAKFGAPMDAAKKRAFAARMRGEVMAVAGGRASPKAPAASPPQRAASPPAQYDHGAPPRSFDGPPPRSFDGPPDLDDGLPF